MSEHDTRHLTPDAQEALRRRVMQALEGGLSQAEAARVFGVSRQSVHSWVRRQRQGGLAALKSGKRGRPPAPRISPREEAKVMRLIAGRCPDQLKLPFALWTRGGGGEAPGRALRLRGIGVNGGPLAQALGLHGVPKQRAAWGPHQAGRSYGLKGRTPSVPGTGRRFGCHMLSTLTNRGRLSFLVFRGRFTAGVFIRFLRRLLRQVKGKVFLIVDRHPVHRAKAVERWLEKWASRIQLSYLPA